VASLARVAAEVNESTGSAFLVAFQQHAQREGFFRPIAEHLDVKLKEVRFSRLQKAQTLIASILLGCPHTKAINERLVPDQVAAREWGMERFPDQSQVNVFLIRMDAENVGQLEQAHRQLLLSHSRLASAPSLVVDFDQTGLRVTGKTFELAEKGYFPRRRGARGYQLSVALASSPQGEPEVVACYLDPGSVVGPARLKQLLEGTLAVFASQARALCIRLDAGYGNSLTVAALQKAEVGFLVKWRDARTSRRLLQEWEPRWRTHTPGVRVAEGPSLAGARTVFCEVAGTMTLLVTNLELGPEQLFDFYNQRQTIEAFFKASKHVFGMANLRSRRFWAIAAFLWFVCLTHNLLVWTKAALFAGTKLATIHTRELVEKVIRVPAYVIRQGSTLRLELPALGVLVGHLREALQPTAVQLPLPYLRL
jgi:Transposase DDE domain group 1